MIVFNDYVNDPRVRREAEALVERGDAVDCICLSNLPQKQVNFRGVNLYSVSARKYRGPKLLRHVISYLKFFFYALLKTSVLHLRRPYQLVQVHTMPDFIVFAGLVPKLLGAKVILDVHDLMPEVYMAKFGARYNNWIVRLITWVERLSIGFADRAICVHQPHLEILTQHGNPQRKFTVLLNVPDHRIFGRKPAGSIFGRRSNRIVYHGSVPDRAGLDTAVKAVALAQREIPDLEFQVIGHGDGLDRITELVKQLGLTESVRFYPVVPVDQLPGILTQATVGVIPYLTDAFTRYVLPTKLMEYAALGIPVITSRLPTIEAYFDEEMVAYFQSGNATELADQIVRLFRDPGFAAKLTSNAAKFSERYNWPQQRAIYYKLVDSLLETKTSFAKAS